MTELNNPVAKPSEEQDIFIHTINDEQVAFQAGREIARMNSMGEERFYVTLQRWVRKNGSRPVWRLDEKGQSHPAPDIAEILTKIL